MIALVSARCAIATVELLREAATPPEPVKFKLDENVPVSVSAAAILQTAGHDLDTVTAEGLTGAPDPDVVAAATAAAVPSSPSTAGWATSAPTRREATPASG